MSVLQLRTLLSKQEESQLLARYVCFVSTCAQLSIVTFQGHILDVVPEEIHQRSPLYMGSKKDVEELLTYLAKDNN